jgi:cytochrome c-type biogenesis protein CcmH
LIRLRLTPVLLGVLLWIASAAASTLAEFKFDSPAQEQQFRELTEELRCLVCQNESLAGSQAELAQDLRREVYQMMRAGKSREEVINFLVARYGDFVLYSPPLKPSTYVLWFGPLVLVVVGAVLLWRVLRRKQAPAQDDLSTAEQQRLQALFDADRPPGNP